jgi:hypothetical protein
MKTPTSLMQQKKTISNCPFPAALALALAVSEKLVEGEVNQEDQSFLEDAQIEKGFVLLCCGLSPL